MPKVSVLMPVYNTKEEFLKESIESILNQTFADFELIILDDGSFNDIETVVKEYTDERIRFYKNEQNLGVAKTRNELMNLAQGEYCVWQDSDDISMLERLEKQVDFLDNNADISILGTNLIRFPSEKLIQQPPFPKITDFIGGCVFSQGTSMFRLSEFKKYNLYYKEDLITSEDYELWSRAVKHLSFANLQEPLLRYRRVGTSLCHSQNNHAYDIEKEIKQNLLDYVTSDKILQKKILRTITSHYAKKNSFFENICSIKNEWKDEKKIKVLTILGIKLRIK